MYREIHELSIHKQEHPPHPNLLHGIEAPSIIVLDNSLYFTCFSALYLHVNYDFFFAPVLRV